MKILDIQKNLLISHLGLIGINEELLDTFPVKKLIEKSDDDVCIVFTIHFKSLEAEVLLNSVELMAKILKIEAKSVEKSGQDSLSIPVYYDSLKMHWSDKAKLHFEELSSRLVSYNVKISTNVSINN
ncbi:hypothetical protein [Halobacteriovorax sp.]|uniref:hypothetical protein n=1 Tax=Halobacteriovorax sp. TaxID=2020862 RepID=UPI00356663A0